MSFDEDTESYAKRSYVQGCNEGWKAEVRRQAAVDGAVGSLIRIDEQLTITLAKAAHLIQQLREIL